MEGGRASDGQESDDEPSPEEFGEKLIKIDNNN